MENAIEKIRSLLPIERERFQKLYDIDPYTPQQIKFDPAFTLDEFIEDRPWLESESQERQEIRYKNHILSYLKLRNEETRINRKLLKIPIEIRAKELLEKKNN